MMKKLFFFLCLSFCLTACQNTDKKPTIVTVSPELVVMGAPDTAVVTAIELTGGKYQYFLIHCKYVKTGSTIIERTKILYHNIGDTVLITNQ